MDDEDDDGGGKKGKGKKKHTEFECPECNANNGHQIVARHLFKI
jgi:hypothetical protein